MSRSISRWTIGLGLCVAALAQGSLREASAKASRPIDEMRGDCSQYGLNGQNELVMMEGVPEKLTALTSRGTPAPMSPIGQPPLVTLHHIDKIMSAAMPKHSGSSVPTDADYRISVGSAVWIEVVDGKARVEPTKFEMQTGCLPLFKTVQYRLKKEAAYWIELSGNMRAVTLLLSSETR
ncbi:MAG: hypothetical protein ABI604_16300 [Nitrospirota bacterium]